jgi:hypothetical protein
MERKPGESCCFNRLEHFKHLRPDFTKWVVFILLMSAMSLLLNGCAGCQTAGCPAPTAAPARATDLPALATGQLATSTATPPGSLLSHSPPADLAALRTSAVALQQMAVKAGYVAMVTQPDPAVNIAFLVVSPDLAAAKTYNMYFSWMLDWSAEQPAQPGLYLTIDHLFADEKRQAALADKSCSQPEIVAILAASLRIFCAAPTCPAIQDFILQAYRRDFLSHLPGASTDPPWTKTGNFDQLEVVYHAGSSAYFTFHSQV